MARSPQIEDMDEQAAFTTPDVGRIFIACDHCARVMPHYKVYGRMSKPTDGMCRCGSRTYRPTRVPEWRAMLWVLVVGWFWRKTIQQETEWDPRMPIRTAEVNAVLPS